MESYMTTPKQAAANRCNAKKSTGPKTAAGRSRSKWNALKHGLTAKEVTLYDESDEDYAEYSRGMMEWLEAVGSVEELLAKFVVIEGWRRQRSNRIEPELFDAVRRHVEADFVASEAARADRMEDDLSRQPLSDERATALVRGDIVSNRRKASVHKFNNDEEEFASLGNIGTVFHRLSKHDPIGTLMRYKTSAERSFYRALHNLERVQARRRGEIVIAPIAVDRGE
jgi:hypothetical protein